MLYSDITELIGNTPLLRLDPGKHGIDGAELYAKLEFCNPFGSVKDRIAWGMIRDDLPGITRRGQTLIEASSGNTAKALQVLAAMHGIRLRVLTNRTKVPEVRDALELLGGELEELPGLSECPDPTVPNDVFSAIEKLMAENPGTYYHTSQYTSQRNLLTHQHTIGKEIFDDIGPVDFLFGGLGTTGSTRGAATYLRTANPRLQTIGIVSTRDDFIPGIRSEAELWEVGLFESDFYAEIMPVRPADAVDAAVDLARRHGVLAGPTSGAAYWAARQYLQRQPPANGAPRRAVIIACDRLEPYLSYIRQRRPELFGQTRGVTPSDSAGPGPGRRRDLRRRAGIARRRCAGPVRRHPREHGVPDRARTRLGQHPRRPPRGHTAAGLPVPVIAQDRADLPDRGVLQAAGRLADPGRPRRRQPGRRHRGLARRWPATGIQPHPRERQRQAVT